MDLFTAEDLLEAAKERFGEEKLQLRMRGALVAGVIDSTKADDELLEVAEGVYAVVRAAAMPSVGWPFPGEDDDGLLYAEKWPGNVFQMALDLFNYRAWSDYEAISDTEAERGKSAEKFFRELEKGLIGLGIGGDTDVSAAVMLSARDRTGAPVILGLQYPDTPNLLDNLRAAGWNTY